jgi:hypothetical protein
MTRTGPWVTCLLLFFVGLAASFALRAEAETAAKVPVEFIRFDHGASGKDISGVAIRGERALYAIGARAGQRLTVSITSEEDNAVFQIYPPGAEAQRHEDGVQISGPTALRGAAEGADARSWNGILPATGDYLIVVGPTRGNATFTLKVAIH